ncbi:MAG: DUF1192 domain-containing protein [Pseudomonadota bacterium]
MFDEDLPRNTTSALADAVREDLDPLSLDQLKERIAVLEAEIVRTKADIERKSAHMSAAEALFKRN